VSDGDDAAIEGTAPPALASLDARQRRRLVLRSALRVIGTTVLVVVVYFVVPMGRDTSATDIFLFVAALVVFTVAVVFQIRRIVDAPLPQLRAIETLAAAIPVFIVIFALVYVTMAKTQPASFNEPISRMTGLYFTVTVISTVGFGDVVATTDTARAVVTIQMVLDLVIIGGLVRAILAASRIGLERRRAEAADRPSPPP
jgi:branched-subunit amino acid ABC-type transport system permease component